MLIIQELFLFCLVSDKKPGIRALPLDPANGGQRGGRGLFNSLGHMILLKYYAPQVMVADSYHTSHQPGGFNSQQDVEWHCWPLEGANSTNAFQCPRK